MRPCLLGYCVFVAVATVVRADAFRLFDEIWPTAQQHKYCRPKKFTHWNFFSPPPLFLSPIRNQNWIKGIQNRTFPFIWCIQYTFSLLPLPLSRQPLRFSLYFCVYAFYISVNDARCSHTSRRWTWTLVRSLWHIKVRLQITNVLNFHSTRAHPRRVWECECVCVCAIISIFIVALGKIYSHIHIDSVGTS